MGDRLVMLPVNSTKGSEPQSLQDVAFEQVLWGQNPCLFALSERLFDKLGNCSIDFLNSDQRGCSPDEGSKSIASLSLEISEST